MKYLVQGMESEKKIRCLIAQTQIEREDLISALIDHFVKGQGVTFAATMNGVAQPNMVDPIAKLNEVACHNERYHELKIYELTSINEKVA